MAPRRGESVIDDSNYRKYLHPVIDGERMGFGLIPRDYATYPREMFDPPSGIPLIPRSEWSARIREMEESKSRLSDIRGDIPSLNQGQVGYCCPPGTKILMADGTLKSIEDIKTLDRVITAEGNVGVVNRTMVRWNKSPLVVPLITGYERLRLTAEHPVLTKKGYVEAGQLQFADCVVFRPDGCAFDTTGVRIGEGKWAFVNTVKFVAYEGWVYNFEVEGDNSYIADGIGVHNCWAHSTVHCVTLLRASANLPYVPLSAYAVAAIIKRGRDEGGWCGLSARFLKEVGVPSQTLWPQGDRNLSRDTREMRDNAAKHKVGEEWLDLTLPEYDSPMSFDQVMSCLLARQPCAGDFNWWGHSVCLLDPVEVEPGSFGIRIWNSWGDSWEDRGMSVLRGDKARPDGALCLRVTNASQD